ncbi:MAG: response regulator [Anaerolineae bacterium]
MRNEVEALGVRLEAISLADVLEQVRAPVKALAEGYGIELSLAQRALWGSFTGDRELAKQAVLLSLSAVVSSRPKAVVVESVGEHSAVGLRIRMRPAAAGDTVRDLKERLGMVAELMSAQGGTLRLNGGEQERLGVVELLFQGEQGASVLVIDDNPRMLQLYGRYLAGGRYRVVVVETSSAAEEWLEENAADAVILDAMMHGVDGWELLQKLRSRPDLQSVPIVVCSVLHEPELASFLGADAYLRKPVLREDLLAALDKLLGESSRVGPRRAAT